MMQAGGCLGLSDFPYGRFRRKYTCMSCELHLYSMWIVNVLNQWFVWDFKITRSLLGVTTLTGLLGSQHLCSNTQQIVPGHAGELKPFTSSPSVSLHLGSRTRKSSTSKPAFMCPFSTCVWVSCTVRLFSSSFFGYAKESYSEPWP